MPEKFDMVVTLRVEDAPQFFVRGATADKCGRCGARVWLSPATLKAAAGAPICCSRCLTPEERSQVANFNLRPEQAAEIRNYFAGLN